jgi:hypothetical protein
MVVERGGVGSWLFKVGFVLQKLQDVPFKTQPKNNEVPQYKKSTQLQVRTRVIDSTNLCRDATAKVTFVARPLFRRQLFKSCAGTRVV